MRVLILLSAILFMDPVGAASFNCDKASTTVEKAVCADDDVSKLDEILAFVYRTVLQSSADSEKMKSDQRKWLQARDACGYENVADYRERTTKQTLCLRGVYISRTKELNTVRFARAGTGRYRCSGVGVNFVIAEGVATEFYAVTAVSSPDLANGNANTCMQDIDKFHQVSGGKTTVLQFYPTDDQFGESTKCQVHIEDRGAKFRVTTTGCRSECMRFNLELEKSACYQGR